MKLSVLSVAYPLAPVGPDAAGGSEQILSQIDSELVRQGHHSVVVACEGSVTQGILAATPRVCGSLDGTWDQARIHHRRAIENALNRWNFDVVHMHSLDFHHYLPAEGPPVLVTLHLPPHWYPEGIFQIARPFTYLQCVSESQQNCCPESRLLLPYVSNGVPLDQLRTHVRRREYVVALGRICPEKGFHLALDAAIEAGTPLLLAGEIFRYQAHERYFWEEIQPRLNGSTRRFLGPVGVARKRRLLAGARCLLVPSLVPETSSLVSMEALACGTPVIAFPSGALAEIVDHGRTGFLVKDFREMAEAIRAVGTIDPEECRRAARERFSSKRMLERYLEMYHQFAAMRAAEEVSAYSARS